MKLLENIPIIEINRDNLCTFWPSILLAAKNSSLLGMDVELSGLGDRVTLNAKSIDDRYKSISTAAASRSILSLGLSCFIEIDDPNDDDVHVFKTQTYNFLTLCDDDFVVEPDAVRFLVEHGFDFNLQYAKGLPYRRGSRKIGNNEIVSSSSSEKLTFRDLFKEILSIRKPIVLHNGLVDLVFLYGNFVGELPSSLQTFVADASELFPGGVYDTKFVADYCARYKASYLEYLFRKCARENEASSTSGRGRIKLQAPEFSPNVEKWVEWWTAGGPTSNRTGPVENLCPSYAEHGWCKNGRQCSLSHDVDAVLDLEEAKLEKKRAKKRRRHQNGTKPDMPSDIQETEPSQDGIQQIPENTASSTQQLEEKTPFYTGAHRSGYDAFMTAFSMACLTLQLNHWPTDGEKGNFDVGMFKNKIALSGKDYPLFIQRSGFAKPSQFMSAFVLKIFSD